MTEKWKVERGDKGRSNLEERERLRGREKDGEKQKREGAAKVQPGINKSLTRPNRAGSTCLCERVSCMTVHTHTHTQQNLAVRKINSLWP